ncbi:hypothetical protein CTI14_00260 [Methylobacterium radiotolerans]|nr:hypothetical protein CTI14_00260 [Methylobacterium radiotolerans]
MAETGIRTTNLPLTPLLEVIGHSDNGNGQPGAVARQKMSDFVQALLALAGLDPSGVADLAGQLNELATQLAGETDDRIAGDASVTFTGDRPLIWDVTGIYGTPQTLYVPRNFYFQKGAAAYNGPGGIESAAMPGYIAFGNISPTLATTIYMDLDAQYPYQLVTYPNQVPQGRVERVVVLATLYNGQVVTNLPVSYADGQSGTASFLAPLSPLVVEENPQDGNLLLVPRLFYYARGVSNGFEPYGPPAGQSHWAVSIPADPLTDVRYFFNLQLAKAGQSPIVAVTGDRSAMFGDARVILLGHSIGGVFSPAPGIMAVGSALGGLAKNQCTISQNADGARYLYNSTKIDAVTEPVLINLGFLRGARDVTNKRPYYGEDLVSAIPDGSLWFRFYVQTDVAGDFGNPTIFINDLASGNPIAVASLNAGTIRQEFTRSPRAASFIGRLDLPPAISGPCYISVGSDNPNGRDLVITGLQYAVTRERLSWIGRLDLDPGDANRELTVLGQDIFLIQGQRLPLRVQNGFAARPRQISLVSCLTSLPASPGGSMYTAQGAPDLVLEADRVGPTGTLSMRSTANAIDLRARCPCASGYRRRAASPARRRSCSSATA